MIEKTKKGFRVVSHSGKKLSSNDLTKVQAKRRLRQVEFFKNLGKDKKIEILNIAELKEKKSKA